MQKGSRLVLKRLHRDCKRIMRCERTCAHDRYMDHRVFKLLEKATDAITTLYAATCTRLTDLRAHNNLPESITLVSDLRRFVRALRPGAQVALRYLASLEAPCVSLRLPGQLLHVHIRRGIETENACNVVPISLADFNLSTDRAASRLDHCLRLKVGVVASQVEQMSKWITFRFAELLAWEDGVHADGTFHDFENTGVLEQGGRFELQNTTSIARNTVSPNMHSNAMTSNCEHNMSIFSTRRC